MEPMGPLEQLAMCCGLNRRAAQRAGFDRAFQQQRNNYFYSPSIAHMSALASGAPAGWPTLAAQPASFMQAPTQPYLLLTQPVIFAQSPQHAQVHQVGAPSRLQLGAAAAAAAQPQHQPAAQQLVAMAGAHQVPLRAPLGSQYAICYQATQSATIYDSPRQLGLRAPREAQQQAQMSGTAFESARSSAPQGQQEARAGRRPARSLNADTFRRLELIETQVDLSQEMELVERRAVVITRAIDPFSLMPHLTPEMVREYQARVAPGDGFVVRFIEIIKRPGQTLGLYIRSVQIESQASGRVREGLVVTKIDSDSPIYSSQVLHVGDEILSINLVEVQGMSLDDVVIIMSIPKRLVLALRIPQERDQLMGARGAPQPLDHLSPPPRPMNPKPESAPGSGQLHGSLSSAALGSPAPRRPAAAAQVAAGDLLQRSRELGRGSPDHSAAAAAAGQQRRELAVRGLHFAPPARAQSDQVQELLNEQRAQLDELDAEISLRAMQQARQQQLLRPNVAQFDRQLAISGSIESVTQAVGQPDRASDGRLANGRLEEDISFDQELANLEREAMIRERPKTCSMFQADLNYLNQPMEQNPNSQPASVARPASTLPRRILPNLPDEQQSCSDSSALQPAPQTSASNPSTLRRPIINNIRLADTCEQSSYFSSSIEAINRELKELRRQRLALDTEDQINLSTNHPISKLGSDKQQQQQQQQQGQ